jgi:hypothetical protein
LDGYTNPIKRNTSNLLIANKDVGIIVNYVKNEYVFCGPGSSVGIATG